MLIINYLHALLVKSRSNESSIYKNEELYEKNKDYIDKFIEDNKDIINKIKELRDKYFAHIDEEINDLFKSISNDELKLCINFLNKLFNRDVSIIANYIEKCNINDSIAVVKGLLNKWLNIMKW